MGFINIFCPSVSKVVLTIVVTFSISFLGVLFLHTPFYLKTGCAPISGSTLGCRHWTFPENINLSYINIILFGYVVACILGTYLMPEKINRISSFLFILLLISIGFRSYYLLWQHRCRAFSISNFKRHEVRCPSVYNPLSWEKFEEDWQKSIQ